MLQPKYTSLLVVGLLLGCAYPDFSVESGSDAQGGGAGADGEGGAAAGKTGEGGATQMSSNSTVGGASDGGASAEGGTTASGGVSTSQATTFPVGGTSSMGGNTSSGGTSSLGGTSSMGGNTSSGGTSSLGGSSAKGGTSSIGGALTLGGTSSVGGSSAKGGASSVGGNTANGGSAATGGTASIGGTTASGGVSAVGGSSSKGGSSATGGTTASGGSTGAVVTGVCGQQALLNPNLDLGDDGSWGTSTLLATAGIFTDESTLSSLSADSSPYLTWLGGGNDAEDKIWQSIKLPATYAGAKLTFRYLIQTNETGTSTKYDYLYVRILDSSGAVLSAPATYSNLDKAAVWKTATLPLTDRTWANQTITLEFYATTDHMDLSSFFIDTVAFTLNPC